MADFFTWVLNFVKDAILLLFSLTFPDGFSFGYMILGIAVVGAVISATIGMVAIVSNSISKRRGD